MKAAMTIACVISTLLTSAQPVNIVFGDISQDEIDMKAYPKDQEAKAVVLYDKGHSIFVEKEFGYDIRFTRHKRIKIFDKSASKFAEVTIPYYMSQPGVTEEVTEIQAVTYNQLNGKLVRKKLDPATVFDERLSERWSQKKFVFPDVQDGSILEVKYVLQTPFHFNLPDWKFQDRIPTLYSEYKVNMIPFYEYEFIVQGTSRFSYQNSVLAKEKRVWGTLTQTLSGKVGDGVEFKDYIHTYVLKDVPAFTDESYLTSINDYIIKMDFQLARFHSPRGGTTEIISTWSDLNKALLRHENFGKYLKSAARLAKKRLDDIPGLHESTGSDRSRIIIEYVKDNYQWNGRYSKYASMSAKDFTQSQTGNSADVNLFLIALLSEAGVNVTPLLLSTRNHGKIPVDYPFDHFVNYVIPFVDDGTPYLTDGTDVMLPFNRVPVRCLNEVGLIVDQSKEETWLELNSNITSVEKGVISMKLTELGKCDVSVSLLATEYESYTNRKTFENDTTKILDFYSEKIGEIDRIKTVNYDDRSRPYSIHLVGKNAAEVIENTIVVRPFLGLPMAENHLRQKKRTYPIDFAYPWDKKFESKIEFPQQLIPTDIPKALELDDELIEMNLKYTVVDNFITAKGNYRFKKAVYSPGEYPRIKGYFDQIVTYFNQPVVFEQQE